MSTADDEEIRAAFSGARTLEPTDAEVAQVLSRARSRKRRTRRRTAVAVLAAGLLLAAAAASATGVLPVGSVIPLSNEPQGDGLTYTSDRTIVAAGKTPTAGRWRMSVANSDRGFCFGIELVDHVLPGARGPDLSEGCGGTSRDFDAGSVGGGTDLPNTTLVHGPAPEEATAVRVTAPGFSRTVKTHDGPDDVRGDFYAIEIPRKGIRNALVNWLDQHGRVPLPGIYVPSTIVYKKNKGPQRPH